MSGGQESSASKESSAASGGGGARPRGHVLAPHSPEAKQARNIACFAASEHGVASLAAASIVPVSGDIVGRRSSARRPMRARSQTQEFMTPTNSLNAIAKTVSLRDRLAKRHSEVAMTTSKELFMGDGPVARQKRAQRFFLSQKLLDLPMFAESEERFINDIADSTEERILPAGATFTEEGTDGESMFFLLRGEVSASVDGVLLETFRVGARSGVAALGEEVLLGILDTWQVTLRAEVSCTICELDRSSFERVVEEYPEEQLRFEALQSAHDQPEYVFAGTLERRIAIFAGFSEGVLSMIDAYIPRRLFFPGEMLMKQGENASDLLILVNGRIRLMIAGKMVREILVDVSSNFEQTSQRLGSAMMYHNSSVSSHSNPAHAQSQSSQAPVSFGDMCFLGRSEARSASVQAISVCQVRVVHRALFMRTLAEHGESIDTSAAIVQDSAFADTAAEAEALARLKIFSNAGVGSSFLHFLAEHLEDRIFGANEVVVEQGAQDSASLYVVSSGKLRVMQHDSKVGDLGPGDVFGETTVLGIASKRTCSVVASAPCHLRALHQRVIMRGLELFPEERRRVLFQVLQKSSQMQGILPSTDGQTFERDLLMKLIAHSPLFGNTSEAFVQAMGAKAENRIYMTGEVIMREGEPGDSMFIIVSGEVGVWQSECAEELPAGGRSRRGSSMIISPRGSGKRRSVQRARIGALRPGSVVGELAALGVVETRAATIEAEALTSMWEIQKAHALAVLNQFPVARRHFADTICRRLDKTVGVRLNSMPLFSEFPERFRTLVTLNTERRIYFPGQEVVREGRTGSAMHVVNIGACLLKKKGVVVKIYIEGSYFGADVMLGINDTYVGSLICSCTCHILSIGRSAYAHVLDGQPCSQASRNLVAIEKQTTKELYESLASVAVRKRIWERMEELLTPNENPSQVFESWRDHTVKKREERHKALTSKMQREQSQCEWLQRRKEAQERARLRRLDELAPSSRQAAEDAHAASVAASASSGSIATSFGEGAIWATDGGGSAFTSVSDLTPFSSIGGHQASTASLMTVASRVLPPAPLSARTPRRARTGCIPPPNSAARAALMLPRIAGASAATASAVTSLRFGGDTSGAGIAAVEAADTVEAMCKNWPTPKPSKYYNLRVWTVLEDQLGSVADAPPLLPLLAQMRSPPPALFEDDGTSVALEKPRSHGGFVGGAGAA